MQEPSNPLLRGEEERGGRRRREEDGGERRKEKRGGRGWEEEGGERGSSSEDGRPQKCSFSKGSGVRGQDAAEITVAESRRSHVTELARRWSFSLARL